MQKKSLLPLLLWLVGCCAGTLLAQQTPFANAREQALAFVKSQPENLGLTTADVSQLRVTDVFVSDHNGVTHVWLQQEHQGIPVYNALFGLHVTPQGEVIHVGHRLEREVAKRVNTTLPSLTTHQAMRMAMSNLGFQDFDVPALRTRKTVKEVEYEGGAVSRAPIPVSAYYLPQPNGQLQLVWMVTIDQANTNDVWTLFVDAQTGAIVEKRNQVVSCNHSTPYVAPFLKESVPAASKNMDKNDNAPQTIENQQHTETKPPQSAIALPPVENPQGTYRVYALPLESPSHGQQTLVKTAGDTLASPYGWHDVNAQMGADYTYTRGNNVWAYVDTVGNNTAATEARSAPGGAELRFDFAHNRGAEPSINRNASVTNLFYVNNMIHDILYRYGFTEASGNYQVHNYGRGGRANDPVWAEALDGSGENNANFAPTADGGAGRMQMYLWATSANVVHVDAPVIIQGAYYGNVASGWGKPITDTPLTAEAIVATDGTGGADATKACTVPTNDLKGKIAFVDRGTCEFGLKALNVEKAGAVACIVCNFEDANVNMGAGAVGAQVTIPVLLMRRTECARLRQFAGSGLKITLVQPTNAGPARLDGSFDNGIILHEYTHGVSHRLTGGPTKSSLCLSNAEQMGEGWSDWVALALTTPAGSTPQQPRGMGTYVEREPVDGLGIRRYPYTTNQSVSQYTYETVGDDPTSVHAVGSVWAAMLWDLYWALIGKYGFDPNLNNTRSGNGRAIQLVMDGMKLQPCSPGFVDGRNAIIAADKINYGGADTCLISEVFARRGLGINASQGLANNAGDGVQNFDPIATCLKELKIKKETLTSTIEPGQDVAIRITLTNHKDSAVTNVTVTDPLPEGLTLANANQGGTATGSNVVWRIARLEKGATLVLNYTAKSDNKRGSIRLFRDEMEDNTADNWYTYDTRGNGSLLFEIQNTQVKTGKAAWSIEGKSNTINVVLESLNEIKIAGKRPYLRFWNRYNTESGFDGGLIEMKKAGDRAPWVSLNKETALRNGYARRLDYQTFVIPFLSGFSGNSNGWLQTYFDLSSYTNESAGLRFRYGTNGGDGSLVPDSPGWWLDDVEILDLFTYDTEVCATSSQGDRVCAKMPEGGVIVNPVGTSNTKSVAENALSMRVQPNPAHEVAFVSFPTTLKGDIRTSLLSTDGRLVQQTRHANESTVRVWLHDVPAGIYWLRVEHASGVGIQKLVIE